MDLNCLTELAVLPVRITARALDSLILHADRASSLRGAFGVTLKRLVCVRPDLEACPPCPMLAACAYPTLFEPRAAAGQEGTVGFEDLPRPYVVRSGSLEQRAQPGDTLAWQVTLIGRAIAQLPYFVLTWQAMGQAGMGPGRGRFELAGVEALNIDGKTTDLLYDRESNRIRNPAHSIEPADLVAWAAAAGAVGEARSLEVVFHTPTRLKHQGQTVTRPEFSLLWRSLQRRLSLLRLAHGAGRPAVSFEASIRLAEEIRLTHWSGDEREWTRFSRRQSQRVPMGGTVGVARYAGDLSPFLPALKLGTLVGVGDNCTFGQGHYEISVSRVGL